ncbi:unnamed protein product [Prorocentrum cordatum]|uniref:Uncharacterized protein n=1 Tax=Prorocentrum cordatum TaxID=2364126 RepID=A0ABN9PUD6_9DINO|nr:unnamed protein product [Polarella glacialis]
MSPNWGVSNAPPVMPLEVLRIRPRERACPFRSSLGGRGERVEHDEGRRQEAGGEGDDEEDSHHRTGKTEREQEQAWARGAPATRPLGPSPPGAASRRSLAARRGAVIGRKEREEQRWVDEEEEEEREQEQEREDPGEGIGPHRLAEEALTARGARHAGRLHCSRDRKSLPGRA